MNTTLLILWYDLRIVPSKSATYQSEECLYPGKQTVFASGYDRIITILVFGQSFQALYQEQPIAFCPMIVPIGVLSLPGTRGTRYRDVVLSQPRGRRSPLPLPPPGHVLIFSFKPVRRVHLDFATIRWKFCASLFSSGCATATLTTVAAKDNVLHCKTRIKYSTLSHTKRCVFYSARNIIFTKLKIFFLLHTHEN